MPNDATPNAKPLTWEEMGRIMDAEASPARDAALDEQDAILQAKYPGQHVAYRDEWDGDTLVRRVVLSHGPTIREMHAPLLHLSDDELNAIEVTFCYPPGAPAWSNHDLPQLPATPDRA